jgi:glutaredoxin-related protein
VPRVFLDGEFIGGADDVTALDSSGQLERMLRSKGLLT